jgi:hypothetical protein
MKKMFCDACSHEIVDSRVYTFDPLKHVVGFIDGTGGGFVDRNSNPVSGVSEHFDLCLSCYNAIHFEAYKVFKVIKEVVKVG